jgi:hypothetical protein
MTSSQGTSSYLNSDYITIIMLNYRRENQRKSQENSTKSEGGKKKERKATNNLNLLSFGDDEFEAESVVINGMSKTIFELYSSYFNYQIQRKCTAFMILS